MKRLTHVLVGLVALCFTQLLLAQGAIEITRGTDKATPIAVVPFGWQGGAPLPEDMADITANDLRNSGMFAPIPRGNMLSYPTRDSEINARDWRMIGADYVVVGQVSATGADAFSLTYSLYNVVREQVVLTRSISGTRTQLRDIAHHLSDEVFKELTGIQGDATRTIHRQSVHRRANS